MSDNGTGAGRVTLEELARQFASFKEESQQKITTLEGEITRLKGRAPEGSSEVRSAAIRRVRASDTFADSHPDGIDEPVGDQPVSRRGALRALGGVAAGGMGLAIGSTLLGADPAAATGGNVTLGGVNSATAVTEVDNTGSGYGLSGTTTDATSAGVQGFDESSSGTGRGVAGGSNNGVGVAGTTGGYVASTATPAGVFGFAKGRIGVFGQDESSGLGVAGQSASGVGVAGSSASDLGVYGFSTGATAMYGIAAGPSGIFTNPVAQQAGVIGDSNVGRGVIGTSSADIGVSGLTSANGQYGVLGLDVSPTGGIGVVGGSTAGTGVKGDSESGLGVIASGGLAPLLLVPAAPGSFGPPITGTHQQGEVYVDAKGALFTCTTSGTPGTWRQLVAAAPAYSDESGVGGQLGSAGSLNLLGAPIRVFDTTVSDPPADKTRAAGPLASGSVTAISLTGYKVTGIGVPYGAVGVIGNLTALNPSGAGALSLYAVGGKVPVPPTLSYKASTTASTLCMIGLSPGGKLNIKVATSATGCTFDTVGFIF